MHDSTAGLEPADGGGASTAGTSERRKKLAVIIEAAAALESIGEHKAARECFDAALRLQSECVTEERKAREGQRRSEAVHGEASSDAQVSG